MFIGIARGRNMKWVKEKILEVNILFYCNIHWFQGSKYTKFKDEEKETKRHRAIVNTRC